VHSLFQEHFQQELKVNVALTSLINLVIYVNVEIQIICLFVYIKNKCSL